MQPIIEIRRITKQFDTVAANRDISLQVFPGQTHAIIGENGAGKSTLMNILAGILEPDSGEILIRGKRVHLKTPNDAAHCGIGMVHQEFMLFDELTVLDNLIMGVEKRRFGIFIDRKQAVAEIKALCEQYHFSIPLAEKVGMLPVSVRQQVEIVKVLYRGADIIILDEPTSVLTPQGIEGLFEAMRFLVSKGKTIILITHKLEEVMAVSDRITVLKSGKLIGTVAPDEVDEKKLADMMVGREVLLRVCKPEKEIGPAVLKVEHLSVFAEGVRRVHDVSFQVGRGEIVGIAGVAGSGQTELVESIFGLRGPDSGKIRYKGHDVTDASPKELRRLKIGYIPQDRLAIGSNSQASALENCIMGYHIAHGFKSKVLLDFTESETFTKQVITQYQVAIPSTATPVGQLSGGNLQKLIIGREFLQENDLLIIEDPTRGVDVGAIEFIWNRLVEIAARGVSILLVSHDLGEILELCDRVLILYNGQIAADKQAAQLDAHSAGIYMLGGNKNAESPAS